MKWMELSEDGWITGVSSLKNEEPVIQILVEMEIFSNLAKRGKYFWSLTLDAWHLETQVFFFFGCIFISSPSCNHFFFFF
jgi:hypothetical protein